MDLFSTGWAMVAVVCMIIVKDILEYLSENNSKKSSTLQVRVKKLHPDAVIPKYAKFGDGGLDLTATSKSFEENEAGVKLQVYGTGLAVEIPFGYVGFLIPRSSVTKTGIRLSNAVGVIDSSYRGEIVAKFDINSLPNKKSSYNVGDRVCQLVILALPQIELLEAEELSETVRGAGGFGSSGK